MKILALISLIFLTNSAAGQELLSCNYVNGTINFVPSYYCLLTANNPNGLDNITSIGGTHLPGFTNADVIGVYTGDGITTNVPTIICNQFPNIVDLSLSFFGIETVAAGALGSCWNLQWVRFWANNIVQLPATVFSNNSRLTYIDLDSNLLTTLPENIFNNLTSLDMIELRNNPFETIPGGLFRGLRNLTTLYMQNVRMTALNPQWFEDLSSLEIFTIYYNNVTMITENMFTGVPRLRVLELSRNPLGRNIHANSFAPLVNLELLYMVNVNLNAINSSLFRTLTQLRSLFLLFNDIEEIPVGTFDSLRNLWVLDLGLNRLNESTIPDNAFNAMTELIVFLLDSNQIRQLRPQWFSNLTNVEALLLDFNSIEDLPVGVFSPFRAIYEIGLWANELKTINRNAFGNLNGLVAVDFDENLINSVDINFFNDAIVLELIYFWQNLCASVSIYNFSGPNRAQNIQLFSRCTDNFLFIVETETDGTDVYSFHPGQSPGIQLRVQTTNEIHIALTPFNFPWRPMIEIFIGTNNNTLSTIRRNQEENVVVVPTPGIIRSGQLNGFRVTWANHAVMVNREGEEWPFIGFTMVDFFPINFYGLRAPLNRASWRVEPVSDNGITPY